MHSSMEDMSGDGCLSTACAIRYTLREHHNHPNNISFGAVKESNLWLTNHSEVLKRNFQASEEKSHATQSKRCLAR
jgi:hypothetical protein